ncbi:hypothetical protein E2C01_000888 [Portunus trituberculatus]|uniref:Uncharacterized protein n=1 Tax=Portunus trituberculatus TaxID=210409 RepID=A0A5B7CFU6_PORTR|nr:hypothetical protein [Portunus trituberculatus]
MDSRTSGRRVAVTGTAEDGIAKPHCELSAALTSWHLITLSELWVLSDRIGMHAGVAAVGVPGGPGQAGSPLPMIREGRGAGVAIWEL